MVKYAENDRLRIPILELRRLLHSQPHAGQDYTLAVKQRLADLGLTSGNDTLHVQEKIQSAVSAMGMETLNRVPGSTSNYMCMNA